MNWKKRNKVTQRALQWCETRNAPDVPINIVQALFDMGLLIENAAEYANQVDFSRRDGESRHWVSQEEIDSVVCEQIIARCIT